MTLEQEDLHRRFLDGLGDLVVRADQLHQKPLTLEASPPLPSRLRVYLYNATNPSGGRSGEEHKIQFIVPGQTRGKRGSFDVSDDRAVLVGGYAEEYDAFIFWDATRHPDFGWSANVQVRTETIERAVAAAAVVTQMRGNAELVVAVPRVQLVDGVVARFDASPEPVPATPPSAARPTRSRGKRYVRTVPSAGASSARVFEVDPNAVDRGTQAHKDTQDALSDAIEAAGNEPLSPLGSDPQFDVAWMKDGVAFVAEVKSVTDANEEKQLRLALGQVLSYAYLLSWEGVSNVAPIIALERAPNTLHWVDLCARYGVQLVWPSTFRSLF